MDLGQDGADHQCRRLGGRAAETGRRHADEDAVQPVVRWDDPGSHAATEMPAVAAVLDTGDVDIAHCAGVAPRGRHRRVHRPCHTRSPAIGADHEVRGHVEGGIAGAQPHPVTRPLLSRSTSSKLTP